MDVLWEENNFDKYVNEFKNIYDFEPLLKQGLCSNAKNEKVQK